MQKRVAYGVEERLSRARRRSRSNPKATTDDPNVDEEDILAALDRNDHEAALTMLMRRYGESLFRYCCLIAGDAATGAEIHQLTYIQAFRDLGTFGRRASLRTWLYAIANNRCKDTLKSQRRWHQRFRADEPMENERDPSPKADERIAHQQLLSALEECVQALPPRVRMAVLLRFQHGLSYGEMARICRERAGTLQARVARALLVLRPCIEERARGKL